MGLSVQAQSELRADVSETISCTDASPTGGGSAVELGCAGGAGSEGFMRVLRHGLQGHEPGETGVHLLKALWREVPQLCAWQTTVKADASEVSSFPPGL